ncbi:S-layer homology domain-containing protein [Paenibacillus sp. SYP-B3998]|uniref:S-layer homology domain-containing protein n=1 Tax=Paenibacillus sp. SYP-B3998 TaxID=2678564 RepID=A0A6G4A2T2_9BACL|nr:S-layer homology domain-containing protein [Paenibacillus sp. SYP-B3998]NEW08695.1 S-layer homology domain-containing protein [Paenibacillus sp. SYP-B3998]
MDMKKSLNMILVMIFAWVTHASLVSLPKVLSAESSGSPVSSTKTSTFEDLNNHWAKSSVENSFLKGFVDGYEDGTFKPESNVTRAEFIKMVTIALALKPTGTSTSSEWYKPYLAVAIEKGIVKDNDFPATDLNKPISRLEMSKVSVRATDTALQDKKVNIDDASVMYNATQKGLIQGLAGGDLAPKSSTTRAQSVTIIDRILRVNNGEKLEVDKYAVSAAELVLKKTNIFSVMPEIFGGKQLEGQFSRMWNPANLVMETSDGIFKGTVDRIIAIDMADLNDPNRGLLGDVDKLTWRTGGRKVIPLVKDFPDSYIILIEKHVDYNKDENLYASEGGVQIDLNGFLEVNKEKRLNGTLNIPATVGNLPLGYMGFIIPKKGFKTGGSVGLEISASGRPPQPNYIRNVLTVILPTQFD